MLSDPTLPRVKMRCEKCEPDAQSVVYAKIDARRMIYQYMCTNCEHAWTTRHSDILSTSALNEDIPERLPDPLSEEDAKKVRDGLSARVKRVKVGDRLGRFPYTRRE